MLFHLTHICLVLCSCLASQHLVVFSRTCFVEIPSVSLFCFYSQWLNSLYNFLSYMNIISTNPQTACHIFRHKMAPHTESNQLPVSTQFPRDWKNYSLRYIKLNVNDVKIIFKKINCKVCVCVWGRIFYWYRKEKPILCIYCFVFVFVLIEFY